MPQIVHPHPWSPAPGGIDFIDPGHPWQRGTNENTNGLLRQYFPKGTDLSRHSLADLRAVEERLNTPPRKVLNWTTPRAVLSGLDTSRDSAETQPWGLASP